MRLRSARLSPRPLYSDTKVETLLSQKRCRLGPGVVTQSQDVELAEVDVLPEHRLVVVGPVDLDIPDATLVVFVELDIGGVLVAQGLFELVIPLVEAVIGRVEAQKLDGITGFIDDRDIAAIGCNGASGRKRKSHHDQCGKNKLHPNPSIA